MEVGVVEVEEVAVFIGGTSERGGTLETWMRGEAD